MRNFVRRMREATIQRGGLFFVLFGGVLSFGGLTFATDICFKKFVSHESLDFGSVAGIAMEKLFVGIAWGSTMWFLFLRRAEKPRS